MKNFIQSSKIQSPNLTSYDFLKTLAVVLMIADHLGYYFFPDNDWWRVVGRLSLPIWLFLIGYARRRDIGPALWIGMALLIAGDMAAGMSIFSLNILAAIIVVRLILDPLMRWIGRDRARFWLVNIALTLLFYWANRVVEYGTLSLLLAMAGYLARQETAGRQRLRQQIIFTVIAYCFFEWLVFGFTQVQFIVMAGGVMGIMVLLESFQAQIYATLTARLPLPVTRILQFTGRHTLAIYVVHLLVFKALGLWLEPARFHAGQFHFYSETGV